MHHAPAQQQVPPADPAALMAMVASAMGVKMAEALKPLAAAATKQTETAIQHKVELGKGKQYTSIDVAWIMEWSGLTNHGWY